MSDSVNRPVYYNFFDIECIEVIDNLDLNFNLGSALKYLWRAGRKDSKIVDLKKAVWYLEREIARRKRIDCQRVVKGLELNKEMAQALNYLWSDADRNDTYKIHGLETMVYIISREIERLESEK